MHVRFVVNILGTKNCTQSVLKPHNKSPETRINAGFPSFIFLFELNRSRWLSCAVVDYAVDVVNFVDDSGRHTIDQIPRQMGSFRSHEVTGRYCTKCNRIIICSEIPHNAYGTHIRQSRKILSQGSRMSVLRN